VAMTWLSMTVVPPIVAILEISIVNGFGVRGKDAR